MQERDLSRTSLESFLTSIASLRRTDLRPRLAQIKIPVMGVYGVGDNIVDPRQHTVLAAGVRHARVKIMPGSRHFPMLDEPDEFNATLKTFLDGGCA
jgi:pimeloyl-ACP methyl ester carboxylesterase